MTSSGVQGDDTSWEDGFEDLAPPVRVEPSPRWVRAVLAGRKVADSKAPLLHVAYGPPIRPESRKPELPTYFFPLEDVASDMLEEADVVDGRQWFHADIDGQRRDFVAWTYADPQGPVSALSGHVTFDWDQMDAWYEEEEEIYEHARDPQHRVDLLASSRDVEIRFDGQLIAASEHPFLLFETTLPTRFYLPPADVKFELLEPSKLVTRCPYKGTAKYWSVAGAGRSGRNVAWSYPDPIPENPRIKGLIAFYNERLDITVDGEPLERPRTPWSRD